MLSRTPSLARASRACMSAKHAGRFQECSTMARAPVVAASLEASRSVLLGGMAAAVTAVAWYTQSDLLGDRKALKAEDAGSHFSGKVVVIAGADGDFGRAGIETFRREGASVVLLEGASKPQALEAAGYDAFAVRCDMTNPSEVDAAVASIEKRFGKITHLWNNAGYQGSAKPVAAEHSADDFEKVQENVVGTFRVLESVASSMKRTGGGIIVNTASVAGFHGTPAMPAYVASKSAVLGLTKSASKDLAPFNIRVNAVSPRSPYSPSAPTSAAPSKHVCSGDEVLKVVVFLMSEDSSTRTGTSLAVEKGLPTH